MWDPRVRFTLTFTGSGAATDAGPRTAHRAPEPAYAPPRHSNPACARWALLLSPRPWPTSSAAASLAHLQRCRTPTPGIGGIRRQWSCRDCSHLLKPDPHRRRAESQARAWIRKTSSRDHRAAPPPVRGAASSRRPSWICVGRGMRRWPSKEPS